MEARLSALQADPQENFWYLFLLEALNPWAIVPLKARDKLKEIMQLIWS
jgi:hypothetical protein